MIEMGTIEARYNAVMLVDDSRIDNYVNFKVLEGEKIARKIYVFNNSLKAFDFIKEIDRTGTYELAPSLIFLDIYMPVMDGLMFIKEFENLSETMRSVCRIVVISNSLNPADMQLIYKSSSVIEYFIKPMVKSNLARLREAEELTLLRQ